MTVQRIHEKLGPMDLLTKQEMSDVFGHHIDRFLRDKYRTIKLMKLPQLRGTAAAATFNLAQGNQPGDYGVPCGPESGFIWMLRRVIVASNVATDAAKYTLYSGSDPSNYDYNHLLEGFTAAGAGQSVGVGYYPSSEATWLWPGEQVYAQILGATVGNGYVLSGIAIEVAAEMVGKLVGP
jgi:hypothetical protein